MTDAAAPSMGIDSAAVAADVAKLTGAGISQEQAQAMAHSRARQLRDLADLRGERQIPIIDGDAVQAQELHAALSTKPEDHKWSLPPEGEGADDFKAAAEATQAARAVSVALDLSPGTAEFLSGRIREVFAKADAMNDAEMYAYHNDGLRRLAEHYGSVDAARAMINDAVQALKVADADPRIVDAFIVGASVDLWSVDTLARRYRAKHPA